MSEQTVHRVVLMANHIALNFGESRDPENAARKTAEHLRKFWTVSMLEQLVEHAEREPAHLSVSVRMMLSTENLL